MVAVHIVKREVIGISESMNIYQKLAKIRKPVEVMKKEAQGYGYKYVAEDEILAKITGLMEKYNVSLVPAIVPGTTSVTPYSYSNTKSDKKGGLYEQKVSEVLVRADTVYYWVNNDNPDDRIEVPWALIGQQSDASQAFGSGLSYCSRYFLLEYFHIATSDSDPDSWRSKQREAEEMEDRVIADGITDQVLTTINTYLDGIHDAAERDKKRGELIDVVKRYAKDKGKASSNPKVIRDPVAAAHLLQEISEKCGVVLQSNDSV